MPAIYTQLVFAVKGVLDAAHAGGKLALDDGVNDVSVHLAEQGSDGLPE
jgi:hypothetical protein